METHKDEQTQPWVVCEIIDGKQAAQASSPPYNPEQDSVHFDPIRVNDPGLKVRLFEALEPGSSTYIPSELELVIPARRDRVIDVQMEETRSSSR